MADDDLINPQPSTSKGIARKNTPNRAQQCSAKSNYNAFCSAQQEFNASCDWSIAANRVAAIRRLLPSLFPFPVTFEQFKMYTHYQQPLEAIIQELSQCNEAKYDKVCVDINARERLLRDYYHKFYMQPDIRKRFPLRLKRCPKVFEDKLLQRPFIDDEGSAAGSSSKADASDKSEIGDNLSVPKRRILSASSDTVSDITEKNYVSTKRFSPKIHVEEVTPPNKISHKNDVVTLHNQSNRSGKEDTIEPNVPSEKHNSFVSSKVCHTESFIKKYIYLNVESWPADVKKRIRAEIQTVEARKKTEAQATLREVHIQSVEILPPISLAKTKEKEMPKAVEIISLRLPAFEQNAEENPLFQTPKIISTNTSVATTAPQQNAEEKSVPKSEKITSQHLPDQQNDKRKSLPKSEEIIPTCTSVETTTQQNAKKNSLRKYCTLAYVLRMSTGLKQHIIEAILKMSFAEFRQYTHIHNSQSNGDLSNWKRLYQCSIVEQQQWPINMYMRLSDIVQYLQLQGLPVKELKLRHISPKLLHWEDLTACTDFDKCVNLDCFKSKAHVIRTTDLLQHRENYYRRCWLHERWIWREPNITDENLLVQLAAAQAQTSSTLEACISVEYDTTLYEFIKVKADAYDKKALAAATINVTHAAAADTDASVEMEDARKSRGTSYVIVLNDNNELDLMEHSSTETVLTEDMAIETFLYDQVGGTISQVTSTQYLGPTNVGNECIDVTNDRIAQLNATSTEQPEYPVICHVAANVIVTTISPNLFTPSDGSTVNSQQILHSPLRHSSPAQQTLKDYSFVDMINTQAQIEALPTEIYPEADVQLEIVGTIQHGTSPTHPIKQEITALNNLQFNLTGNSDDYSCTPLSDQIVDIDGEISNFVIFSPLKRGKTCGRNLFSSVDLPVASNLSAVSLNLSNSEEFNVPCEYPFSADTSNSNLPAPIPASATTNIITSATTCVPATTVTHTTTSVQETTTTQTTLVSSRTRRNQVKRITKQVKGNKIGDFVPQKTHKFRALPVQIIGKNYHNARLTENGEAEVKTTDMTSSPVSGSTFSVSQALATDCTLFNTQLLQAVEEASRSPCVPVVPVTNGGTVARSTSTEVAKSTSKQVIHSESPPAPQKLYKTLLYRTLHDFYYFENLTAEHVARYSLPSNGIGQRYMQAVISSGRKTTVHGNFLDKLFAHCAPQIVRDLQLVLTDLGEYHYNKFDDIQAKSKDTDLRQRVLRHFLRFASPFKYCRLKFDDMSREFGHCQAIVPCTNETLTRRPHFSLTAGIKPSILKRMAELKSQGSIVT